MRSRIIFLDIRPLFFFFGCMDGYPSPSIAGLLASRERLDAKSLFFDIPLFFLFPEWTDKSGVAAGAI
jgi:hypothetical protein